MPVLSSAARMPFALGDQGASQRRRDRVCSWGAPSSVRSARFDGVSRRRAGWALDALFGCTCVNDVTAIGLLKKDPGFPQWTRSKAADTFGVLGPAVATGLDPSALRVRTEVNGRERQNYPVTDMVFTAADLISRLSFDLTLEPGDVIACGTSVGVGSLRDGDVVTVSIEGVGELTNPYEDSPAR